MKRGDPKRTRGTEGKELRETADEMVAVNKRTWARVASRRTTLRCVLYPNSYSFLALPYVPSLLSLAGADPGQVAQF